MSDDHRKEPLAPIVVTRIVPALNYARVEVCVRAHTLPLVTIPVGETRP